MDNYGMSRAHYGEDTPAEQEDTGPTENERKLTQFVIDHTDSWRDYRDQNHLDEWLYYERIWRGKWDASDKGRDSERSRMISPATQQAIETRHAEIIEAVFGQGEFFEISDDLADKNGNLDIEKLKQQLKEDFSQDGIRKSIDSIVLMGEIYGTGIGEIVVGSKNYYVPAQMPINSTQVAYGSEEKNRISVKIDPVNPKNFLFDPNGTSVDDCMGVAIEKHTSIHKITAGIEDGTYKDVDISSLYEDDSLEPTQESRNFQTQKIKLLTYYGLVPRKYLMAPDEEYVDLSADIDALQERGKSDESDDCEYEVEKYEDLVEAIVVIANNDVLLKAVESPYMMKDRPVLTYQADTVPNRLLGRGTAEKAANMQKAIDGSMRSHMDALALTVAPMVGLDATRLPRGVKFEVKPGKHFMVNGAPNEIIYPFKFGNPDGSAMETSREFERMLLMATSTVDSAGAPSMATRDVSGLDPAIATMLKKYKRVLVNFQEDFLIPFVQKAAWRYMQFDPKRYPAVDVKFIPSASLGIIAREYEQKQLAFLIQTLGAQSPLTPILMQSIVANSSLSNRGQLLAQLEKASQPDPMMQQQAQMQSQVQAQVSQADTDLKQAQVLKTQAEAQLAHVRAQVAPSEAQARIIAALSNNLNEDNEGADFERRAKIAELMLKEKDIESNEDIAKMQMTLKHHQNLMNPSQGM